MKHYFRSISRWGYRLICLLFVAGCEPDQFVSMGSDGATIDRGSSGAGGWYADRCGGCSGATVAQDAPGGEAASALRGDTAGLASDNADPRAGCGGSSGSSCVAVGGTSNSDGVASAAMDNGAGEPSGIVMHLPSRILTTRP